MGSKRWMLANGLGKVLVKHARNRPRFLDLFSGSAAVAWHIAAEVDCVVVASDIQAFASTLAAAVIERTEPIDHQTLEQDWLEAGVVSAQQSMEWRSSPDTQSLTADIVHKSREFAAGLDGYLTSRYGGHYLSPRQALLLDRLRSTAPVSAQTVCMAALVIATSRIVASPGHTAQPFQPRNNGLAAIDHAWARDPSEYVRGALRQLAPLYAHRRGYAKTATALSVAREVTDQDVVFLDPPYSAVQYSRFYHVLEAIAAGGGEPVSGVGRYPPNSTRPQSNFSKKSTATAAMREVLDELGQRNPYRVIVTFRSDVTSNGLSAAIIRRLASRTYRVDEEIIDTRISTLGGNNVSRNARATVRESIIVLRRR